MKTQTYHVLGVMSGTSLDGIDLCCARFNYSDRWDYQILKAKTINYTSDWVNRLRNATTLNIQALENLNVDYTAYLGAVINQFIDEEKIEELDAVCSHGHTIFHQPENQLTLQIGNLQSLASIIKQRIVCDFRVQDVALSGQGAPLVPIGDKYLFSEFDFCLNLGGFANGSFDINNERIAFDICPVNIVLNHYVHFLGFDYDDEGKIASAGQINDGLLKKLNALGFYKENSPKSLGYEWVSSVIFPVINVFNLSVEDILRTFIEHIAVQIGIEINRSKKSSILITGGGVFNSFLIERIGYYTKSKINIPKGELIEFKEALIFGFLGILRLRKEVNCLSSVTGANQDHSSGKIFLP